MLHLLPAALTLLPNIACDAAEVPKGTSATTAENVSDIDLSVEEPQITDRAYIDLQIGSGNPQRVTIALYGTVAPKTVDNFIKLIKTGYADTSVYRVVPGLTIQLGDVLGNNGKSGRAATDEGWLPAENFRIQHSIPGTVSMVVKEGRVDSRFFITTRPGDSAYLDGKYVGFGRVVDGTDWLHQIERANDGFVRKPTRVTTCGIL